MHWGVWSGGNVSNSSTAKKIHNKSDGENFSGDKTYIYKHQFLDYIFHSNLNERLLMWQMHVFVCVPVCLLLILSETMIFIHLISYDRYIYANSCLCRYIRFWLSKLPFYNFVSDFGVEFLFDIVWIFFTLHHWQYYACFEASWSVTNVHIESMLTMMGTMIEGETEKNHQQQSNEQIRSKTNSIIRVFICIQ